MAKRVPSRSSIGRVVTGLWLLMVGCRSHSAETPSIPAVFVPAEQSGWQRREGQLWLRGKPFSGWQYGRFPDGDTAFVGGYRDGKAEGLHRFWYENHRLKETRQFRQGWQEGEQRGWYATGKPAFRYQFRHDVYEGRRREWYPDGRLARDGHYHDGQEDGAQRMWFADEQLKANYVVRKGRTYGFTGVKNCVNAWDSITVSH